MNGLIKATNLAMRLDTNIDLARINQWLEGRRVARIKSYGETLRALENSVALGLEKITDRAGLPKLERSERFYTSILPEITDKERNKFNAKNIVCE